MESLGFIVGIILLLISFLALAMSKISYRFRAFINKKAWGGLTLPSLSIGVLTLVFSLVLIYAFYPF